MTNYSKFSDPIFNPAFRRRWHDEPLDGQGLRHLGDEVAPLVVEGIGRRAVAYWLDRASQASGVVAAKSFRQADSIRRTLGLGWGDLIDERRAA